MTLCAKSSRNFLTLQPVDYEPPFFRCCTEEETRNPWTKNPLKMEVGNVNSKHLVLALKVRNRDFILEQPEINSLLMCQIKLVLLGTYAGKERA